MREHPAWYPLSDGPFERTLLGMPDGIDAIDEDDPTELDDEDEDEDEEEDENALAEDDEDEEEDEDDDDEEAIGDPPEL
jgi:hypothetical protein